MNVLVVDDDVKDSALLKEYLLKFARENEIDSRIEVCNNGSELAMNYVPEWDLILLDVEMPIMDGFEVAKSIRETDLNVGIMFVTNLAQYAIRGYEVQALDYVLKPVSYYALSMKLKKISGLLEGSNKRSVLIPSDGNMNRVSIDRICYIEVADHAIIYHTLDGDIRLSGKKSLSMIEEEMSGESFVRSHNSFLINLKFIKGIKDTEVLVMDKSIPVSRSRRRDLMQALMEYVKRGNIQ